MMGGCLHPTCPLVSSPCLLFSYLFAILFLRSSDSIKVYSSIKIIKVAS